MSGQIIDDEVEFETFYDDTTNRVIAGAATVVALGAAVYLANTLRPLKGDALLGESKRSPEETMADKLSEKIYSITMDFYKEIISNGKCLYTDVDTAHTWAQKQETPLAGNKDAMAIWKDIMEISAILVLCAKVGSLILDYTYHKKAAATSVTVLIYDMIAEYVHLTCMPESPIRKDSGKMTPADTEWLGHLMRAVELFKMQLIEDFKQGATSQGQKSPIMTLLNMNRDEIKYFAPFMNMCDNKAILNENDFIIWDPSTNLYMDAEILMDRVYERFIDPTMNRRYKGTVDELNKVSTTAKNEKEKKEADKMAELLKQAFNFAVDVVSDVPTQSERVNQFADIVLATSGVK